MQPLQPPPSRRPAPRSRHVSEPRRFARTLIEFVSSPEPAEVSNEKLRQVLLRGRG